MNTESGLTVVEIMIAIGILAIILSFGLAFSFESFRGYMFRSDRDTLNSVLSRARSRAMNNYYDSQHGACFDTASGNFILFRGSAYSPSSPTNEVIKGNGTASITSIPTKFLCSVGPGVVFSQLSGTTTEVDIGVYEQGRVSTTTINEEGTIIW